MILRKILIPLFACFLLIAHSAFYTPTTSDADEYNIKAAFVYRFREYIEWPGDSNTGITIGILGESAIVKPLKVLAKDNKVSSSPITIEEYNDLSAAGKCQILFISRNNKVPLESIISRLGRRPVLLIAEQKDACDRGVHINFHISQNKLKFEVNLRSASRAGLKMSSQFLQHASQIVN